jgi:hypothetical protein
LSSKDGTVATEVATTFADQARATGHPCDGLPALQSVEGSKARRQIHGGSPYSPNSLDWDQVDFTLPKLANI